MESIRYEILNGNLPMMVSIVGNGLFFYYEIDAYGEYSFNDIPCGDYLLIVTDNLENVKYEHITLPTVL